MTEDTSENRVTLTEAARIAGVHFNTVRNWRKAGRLKTAEKVLANGIEIWTVALSEVQQIVQQASQQSIFNSTQQAVDNNAPESSSTTAISANAESTLSLIREVTKPLTEIIERQEKLIENQSSELGNLREELGQVKERLRGLEASQASQNNPQSAKHTQEVTTPLQSNSPAQNTSNEAAPNQATKKRPWWERWI